VPAANLTAMRPMRATTLRRLDRRGFLLGALGSLTLTFVGCGTGDGDAADAIDEARLPAPPAPAELATREPVFVEDARAFLVEVPTALLARARALLPPETRDGLDHRGLLALSDVCPKEQLQLRHCPSSRWFFCPGCGSVFDALGDQTGGPAPRGMSFFRVRVDADDEVSIDRHPTIDGLRIGLRIVDQPAAGPHCS
jgi:hypothetical protein